MTTPIEWHARAVRCLAATWLDGPADDEATGRRFWRTAARERSAGAVQCIYDTSAGLVSRRIAAASTLDVRLGATHRLKEIK